MVDRVALFVTCLGDTLSRRPDRRRSRYWSVSV